MAQDERGHVGGSPQVGTFLAEITASLVSPDQSGAAVLGLVTEACVALLGGPAVGIMLVDPRGGTDVVIASDEQARFLELLQSQIDEGPCIDCVGTDQLIEVSDLSREERWPEFTPAAIAAGYRAVQAVPMRLAGRAIGGLNVLHRRTGEFGDGASELVQALADLAALGLSQEPDPQHRWNRVTERTLAALNDRVMLAQAVGLITGSLDVDQEQARRLLRQHALSHRLSIRQVARAITQRTMPASELLVTDPDSAGSAG